MTNTTPRRVLQATNTPANPEPSPVPWADMTPYDRANEMQRALERGEALELIGTRLSVSKTTLSRWCATNGMAAASRQGHAKAPSDALWYGLTADQRDEAVTGNASDADVALAYGVAPSVIFRWRLRSKTHVGYPSTNASVWRRATVLERTEHIKTAFANGLRLVATARSLGTTSKQIYEWCRRYDIPRPAPPLPSNTSSAWLSLSEDEKLAAFKEAMRDAPSRRQVALRLGVANSTVNNYALSRGIVMPPPSRTRAVKGPAPLGGNVRAYSPRPTRTPGPNPIYTNTPRHPADKMPRVHLLDIRAGLCKFPLWPDTGRTPLSQMFYCGDPTDTPAHVYCAHCRAVTIRAVHDPRANYRLMGSAANK